MTVGVLASGTIAVDEQSTAIVAPTRPQGQFSLTMAASGTFNSTVLTLQGSNDDGTTWITTGSTLNATGAATTLHRFKKYRISAASGTGTGIKWWLT